MKIRRYAMILISILTLITLIIMGWMIWEDTFGSLEDTDNKKQEVIFGEHLDAEKIQ